MKKTSKAATIGIVVSSLALVVSLITGIIFGFGGTWVTMFCCMIAVFCSNIAIYAAEKKKGDGK